MSQISFFDGSQPLKITKPIRLIELFAGIGAQAKALERIGVEFEHYRVCEFDPYAVTSYNAIHGTNFEPSDITKWKGEDLGIFDVDRFTYLLTYSFPCQSLSLAGRQEGMQEGSETRSALLWEVKRLLQETDELPHILVMENVPQVASAKNKTDFEKWINFLRDLGYSSKWEILNSKDFEVPQNRSRCFMVSWIGDLYYNFPATKPLKKVLRDLLLPEDEIDEKYYLSEKGVNYVLRREGKYTQIIDETSQIEQSAITAVGNANWTGNFIKCEKIGYIPYPNSSKEHQSNVFYSPDGLCPTIDTCGGGNREPKIMVDEKSCSEQLEVYDMYNAKQIDRDIVGTITSACSHQGSGTFCVKTSKSPIRKLTQKECWRLMDFDDADYEKARKALNEKFYKGKDKSGSQLYKQAGNSIVVNCLCEIFKQMLWGGETQ
jgi:DNA (cytosine-5)-methyltransferase 1